MEHERGYCVSVILGIGSYREGFADIGNETTIEAEDADPLKAAACAYSAMVRRVADGGYGIAEGFMSWHTTEPHKAGAIRFGTKADGLPETIARAHFALADMRDVAEDERIQVYKAFWSGNTPFEALSGAYSGFMCGVADAFGLRAVVRDPFAGREPGGSQSCVLGERGSFAVEGGNPNGLMGGDAR